jgi:hypothetical protein
MEMVDMWNRHKIAVDEKMAAFVEVPSHLKQFLRDGVPPAIFWMLSLSS